MRTHSIRYCRWLSALSIEKVISFNVSVHVSNRQRVTDKGREAERERVIVGSTLT